MFSKRVVFVLMGIFLFLSVTALITNMPEKKDPAVMAFIKPHFPYELTKTLGGLDLVDKRTGEKLKLDNAKVFLAYDHYLKKWGKTHLRIENDTLVVTDDNGSRATMPLTAAQRSFVERFFFKPGSQPR